MVFIEKVKKQLDLVLENPLIKELESSCKLAISDGLSKLNIVNQEEFDIQRELLDRMRKKIELLEEKISELERKTLQSKYEYNNEDNS